MYTLCLRIACARRVDVCGHVPRAYVCERVRVYTCVCLWEYARARVWACARTHVYGCLCVWMCGYMCVRVRTCVRV